MQRCAALHAAGGCRCTGTRWLPTSWLPSALCSPAAPLPPHLQLHCQRWLCCARNKLWWMTPEWGKTARELPPETQVRRAGWPGEPGRCRGCSTVWLVSGLWIAWAACMPLSPSLLYSPSLVAPTAPTATVFACGAGGRQLRLHPTPHQPAEVPRHAAPAQVGFSLPLPSHTASSFRPITALAQSQPIHSPSFGKTVV